MITNEKAETSERANGDCILKTKSFICNNFLQKTTVLRTSVKNACLLKSACECILVSSFFLVFYKEKSAPC